MRAALLQAHGLDGIDVARVAAPAPGDGEVLIRVETVGVNQLDLNVIVGRGPGAAAKLPRILGIDPAGEVVEVGAGVDRSRVGERVVVKPNIPCGRCDACLAGHEADCPAQQVVGVHLDGGAAEYVAVPAEVAFDRDGLDAATATATIHSLPIVLNAFDAAGVRAGERVLVTGASGTLGRVAIEYGLHLGADVTAATRHPLDDAPDGARVVVTGPDADLAGALERAAAVTGLEAAGFDAVVDVSGSAALLGQAIAALGWRGRAAFCAASVDTRLTIDARDFYLSRKRLAGVASADLDQVRRALDLVRDGAVRPRIGARYVLDNVARAYREFPTTTPGKVIIDVR
ncbi:alcohol dehydrogenase catalytic domain-containing protein [Agromyces aurantiacus]|uniref:Alcohol dehydrogenase catalytic domain-containing protein n=1 Tax=Agromyces aurantiacus TaxID=165814 RepID=A0ABV9R6E5_9MICO|nr:alcohol dehydrogenase catalytic domain-containing protein [Agromyces aurantiacus]MBM7502608.1 D-arabinose 1-dehydrogenase-like Zn-dependent alcohol dehydrogenase [Agromyces aurantiacus]